MDATLKARPAHEGKWWYYLLAILFVVAYLLPIYVLLNLSIRTVQTMGSALAVPPLGEWNWSNYLSSLANSDIWMGFRNSLVIAVATIVLEIGISALSAYGVARSTSKLTQHMRTINILIMMIPGIALLVGTYGLMVKLKMVNSLLGLALLSAAGGIPGTMFMYVNFIVSIPRALDEAAEIDGAGVLRTFFAIILPQLKAVTVTRVIMTAVGSWNNYLMPMFLLTDKSKYTVILVIKAAFAGSNGVKNVPLACATCVIGLIPIIAVYLLMQRFIIEGQMDSAIK
ncbi:MAG: carbohydrate ABC transporter permease [Clostridia bacterium]|nr:carbohydrate ABC transporter permease [Clostridia bacterium]